MMALYRVFNGFRGEGFVCALLEAESETEALAAASDAFRKDAGSTYGETYWKLDGLKAEVVTLPEVGEWG